MIDRRTWLILGDRLEVIHRHREELLALAERIELVFDSHDQARIIRTGLDDQVGVGDTPSVPPP